MDERGYCRIEGRLKEMIIRRGIAQLFLHLAVADVAVVGVPDPRWGEVIAAFVRAAAGMIPTEEELWGFVAASVAAQESPVLALRRAIPIHAVGEGREVRAADRFSVENSQNTVRVLSR